MKKVLSLVLVVMMLATSFALATSAKVGDEYQNYGEIANVERKSIRLDAVKEDVYDKATPIAIKTVVPYVEANISADPRENGEPIAEGTAYMVYDTEYIWVYVEVIDPTLATRAADALSSKYSEDSIEIVIDWTNAGENIPNDTPYQSRLSHEGYISARQGQRGTTMQGTALQGSINPVNWLQGTAEHITDDNGVIKGYNCEFRIDVPDDKYDIGEYISLGFMINDYDSTGDVATRRLITADTVQNSQQWEVEKMGYIKFNYAPYTADTTIIYVVVAMVVALALGTTTLVSLRRRAK